MCGAQHGLRAMHKAAARGMDDVLGVLMTAGAEKNSLHLGGETPLMRAATNGHASTVKLLLKHGVHTDSTNGVSHTPSRARTVLAPHSQSLASAAATRVNGVPVDRCEHTPAGVHSAPCYAPVAANTSGSADADGVHSARPGGTFQSPGRGGDLRQPP